MRERALTVLVVVAFIAVALAVAWLLRPSGPNDPSEPQSWGEFRFG